MAKPQGTLVRFDLPTRDRLLSFARAADASMAEAVRALMHGRTATDVRRQILRLRAEAATAAADAAEKGPPAAA